MRTFSLLATLALLAACTGTDKPSDDGDGDGDSANSRPIAEAGEAISQTADTPVALTGAASSDPDGDALTYNWSFDHVPEGSALATESGAFVPNHTAEAVATTFSADAVGTYVVKLTVTDTHGAESDPDFVIVNVEDPETLPVADAGTDLSAEVGALVTLDGSESYDPQGRTLTYAWSVVDKPTASSVTSLTSADTVGASFTPDAKGVYVLNLVVNNGLARSSSDAVTVTALGDDGEPTANAGADQDDASDCTTLQLDCSASADPDGDTLQYLWEVQSKPTGSTVTNATFSDRTSATPTFYPDIAGEYLVSCAVTDGTTWSTPDLMTINAEERRSNERPVVSAGTNATVDGGSATCEEDGYSYDCDDCSTVTTTLGATATATDADGDPLTIVWTTENDDATIEDASSLQTSVTLEDAAPTEPGECEETEYDFTVTVTDCTGVSESDTITLSVSCCGVEDTSAR